MVNGLRRLTLRESLAPDTGKSSGRFAMNTRHVSVPAGMSVDSIDAQLGRAARQRDHCTPCMPHPIAFKRKEQFDD